ncbi:hypothetical protein K7X08_010840 [Anisodus acutangulus]|uniref:Multifunctional fusion protein n=1 Tax=Anisodus acutangulus TaxID=402998 RepID=A0A9Q1M0G1_9SOLA|nr:hypothetical protein K7X08_010840 [Anisodus acutangulus]
MKDFAGTPGTLTGLFLRMAQCFFAAGAIASMVTTKGFFNVTAFCYLIASMALQVFWSIGLAFLDAYFLAKKKTFHNHVLLSLFVVGDWCTAILSLAAAASSAGVTVLCFHDLGGCGFASFNHGMNPHVYITYRHIVAGFSMLPFAYFLERKTRPKLTIALLFCTPSLLGVSLTLNMYFVSLNYTSPTLLASMVNTIAALTFVLAVIFRLEDANIRDPRGAAKIIGTLVSLAGVMSMTLYKGPVMKSLGNPLIYIHRGNGVVHENWLKGSILTAASCITWSIWYIMQGIVISDLVVYIQLWCSEQKGPVFVTVFQPTLNYTSCSSSIFRPCIIGAVIVITGLYLLLWGKEDPRSEMNEKEKCRTTDEVYHEDPKMQKFTSDADQFSAEP